jgi:hypothetical protein
MPIEELSIDGLLDDWAGGHVIGRAGSAGDGAIELRCAWDGKALAIALLIEDERVVRVKGGREDRVELSLAAGGKPVTIEVRPGNALAKAKIARPPKTEVADSLQPAGFSIELAVPAAAIPQLSTATSAVALRIVFHDSDQAAGGAATPIELARAIELGDRKDLLDDFLSTVRLGRADVRLDTLAELDPDRAGKERLIVGGTVIGVLTDQFAYVTLPAASAADVLEVTLLPLGPRGQQVVAAIVRQSGNGGSRELLMLWTVWSGQFQPLAQIEVRKQMGANVLESTWKVTKGKKGPELWVEPKPAIGWTAETWNEVPAADLDPIALPWDLVKRGTAYALRGAELERRDLPVPKRKK